MKGEKVKSDYLARQISLKKAIVNKKMRTNPRMISQIDIKITFPSNYDDKIKKLLERTALNCPVHKSLSDKIQKNIEFIYS